MFNVTKNEETKTVTMSCGEDNRAEISFVASRGHQTKAVINLINVSYDHDNKVEILNSDELCAGALKIYELCGSKLNVENAANVARSHIRGLMNEGKATFRTTNFSTGKRGRKVGSKNAAKEVTASTVEETTTDAAPEDADDNTTIGDTMTTDAVETDTNDAPVGDETTIGDTIEETGAETSDENTDEVEAEVEAEVVENVESPVKTKSSKKSKKTSTEEIAA